MSQQFQPPSGPPPNKRSRVDSHNGPGTQVDRTTSSSREQTKHAQFREAHLNPPQAPPRFDRMTPEYDPPTGAPPGWQPKDVEMSSAGSDTTQEDSHMQGGERYAPPPGPPPSHRKTQDQPPPYDPWQTTTPTTAPPSHLPPAFATAHPPERSSGANASYSDAERAHTWCRANPLWRARTPDARTLARVAAGELRLTTPPNTTDVTIYQPGRGKTYLRSMSPRLRDTILLSDAPVYVAQAHRPGGNAGAGVGAGGRTVVYFEVQILSSGGADRFEERVESGVAVGFAAPPYPAWRLPGWHRGSLAVHGDDGRRYVDNSLGGRPFVRPFGAGDVVGVGIVYSLPPSSPMSSAGTGAGAALRAEVFFTRNGRREGGWDLHEERDAAREEGDVTGLEGQHDLLAAVGVFGFVEIETRFAREDWLYVPEGR